jgi:hypothetical protein
MPHLLRQKDGHFPVERPYVLLKPLLDTVLHLNGKEREDLAALLKVQGLVLELRHGLRELLVLRPVHEDARVIVPPHVAFFRAKVLVE